MGARTAARFLLAALLVAGAAAASDVLTLTAKNFDDEIAKADFIAVSFTAPWCGHCKTLKPHWEKAATALKKEGLSIKLANVDATEDQNKPLGERFEVKGFPTIKLFRKGTSAPTEYQGPRETEGIVSYMKKQGGPASAEITKAAELEEKRKGDEVVVMGFFPGGLKGPEYDTFMAAAQLLRDDYVVVHSADPSVIAEDCPSEASLIIFKNFDDLRSQSADFSSAEAVKAFVDSKSLPWVVELNQEPKNRPHLKKLFEKPSTKVLGFVSGEGAEMRAALTAAAQKHSALKFVIVDAAANEQALKYFGLEEKDVPAYVIHEAEADKKYVKENAAADDVGAFITAFTAGELKQRIKSEAEPEDNSGPVLVLTANNWAKNVVAGKTYMLEFYAPWCGHCKSLTPIYEKVGAHFKSNDAVVIAKLDATANDVPDARFSVKGFPTLYLLTATGEVVPYNGGRTEAEIVSFVEKYAAEAGAEEEAVAAPEEHDEL